MLHYHFLFMPGGQEILIILIIILLLFGGRKIPELMRGLGKGIREFKKASDTDEPKNENDEPSSGINKIPGKETNAKNGH